MLPGGRGRAGDRDSERGYLRGHRDITGQAGLHSCCAPGEQYSAASAALSDGLVMHSLHLHLRIDHASYDRSTCVRGDSGIVPLAAGVELMVCAERVPPLCRAG